MNVTTDKVKIGESAVAVGPDISGAAEAEADRRTFTVADANAGQRLDKFLATELPDISRSRVQGLIASGQVTLDGVAIGDGGQKIKPGSFVSITVPPPAPALPAGEEIPLTVVYEDDQLIVIDKPAGLVVHPSAGHDTGTLVNALIAHCGDSLSGIGGVRRPGIVHRLDRDTTGLMVVAKTDAAHRGLAEQFAIHGRDGRLQREYISIVWGALPSVVGTIDAPLARSSVNRTRMQVVPKGSRARIGKGGSWIVEDEDEDGETRGPREAITHYQVVETFMGAPAPGRAAVPLASMVRVSLETGRTHQIRVHMGYIGHPVLGDPTYGAGFRASERRLDERQAEALAMLGRQALHAAVLGFEHPVTGEILRFESPLPDDMDALATALRGVVATKAPRRAKSKPPAKVKGIIVAKVRAEEEDENYE